MPEIERRAREIGAQLSADLYQAGVSAARKLIQRGGTFTLDEVEADARTILREGRRGVVANLRRIGADEDADRIESGETPLPGGLWPEEAEKAA